jgi:hypothetical protein
MALWDEARLAGLPTAKNRLSTGLSNADSLCQTLAERWLNMEIGLRMPPHESTPVSKAQGPFAQRVESWHCHTLPHGHKIATLNDCYGKNLHPVFRAQPHRSRLCLNSSVQTWPEPEKSVGKLRATIHGKSARRQRALL